MSRGFILMNLGLALATLIGGAFAGPIHADMGKNKPPASVDPDPADDDLMRALSVGYELLGWVLENEAQLDKLVAIKTLKFDRPNAKMIDVMRQVAEAADNTLKEYNKYLTERPKIEAREHEGRFGDVLRAATRQRSKEGLMERSPDFSKRMLMGQAQALSLIVSLSEELAKIDPNKTRQSWLGRVARDYDKMYGVYVDLIQVVNNE